MFERTRRSVAGTLLTSAIVAASLAGPASAKTPAPSLERAGELRCTARLSDNTNRLGTMSLDCMLEHQSEGPNPLAINGELVGSRGFVGAGKSNDVTFEVLTANRNLDLLKFEGDYDRATSRNYDLGDTKEPLLFGGERDLVVLKPKGDAASTVGPSSRLTLTIVAKFGLRN